MIWLYRILFLPIFIVVFPAYVRRMLKRGGYGKDFMHRFGGIPALPKKRKGIARLWIQAVSVGEIQAVEPLVRHFSEKGVEVVLTTTTSTAYKILNDKYRPLLAGGGIFPIDFWPFSRRAWKKINPDLVILMEGELWPEHLYQAHRRKVPVCLLNGRLSDRSFGRYRKHMKLARWVFGQLDHVLASTKEDAERFANVGVSPAQIQVCGNLKFDVDGERMPDAAITAVRKSLGFGEDAGTRVLIGASTWPQEEALLLDVFKELRQRTGGENWRLLLIPRHAERRDEVVKLLEGQPLPWIQRSKTPNAPHSVAICLADTTGELRTLVQTADLAFIGKSLPPNDGGQTPIEAAVFGVAMVYGPQMSNFRPICRSLETARAAVRVDTAQAASDALLKLACDASERQALSEAAKIWHQANRGAAARSIRAIEQALAEQRGS